MELIQRAFDALLLKLREGRLLRDHGVTILYGAAGALAALILVAPIELRDFAGRPIGQASIEKVSIGARTALVPEAIALFLGVAALLAWVLPGLKRKVGEEATRALEATSLVGLALLWLAVWKVWVVMAVALLAAGQIALVGLAFFDRKRPREIEDRGSYTLWLGVVSFALLFPLHDFFLASMPSRDAFVPLFVLAAMIGLDLVRRAARYGRPSEPAARASDRFVHALTPLATLPAITVMRNELYLLLNQWGVLGVTPNVIEASLIALVLGWCVARAWRGPTRVQSSGRLDVERVLGRCAFPWLLGGFSALGHFYFMIEPSPDFLEPANAGIFIQQLFEFGRWPFFETFNAHGLADSFFGFVYTALVGFKDQSWQMLDFLFSVAVVLVAFQVLRRITGGAAAAFFVLIATPLVDPLFPGYCALSAVAIFVVQWAIRQRSARSWAQFFAFLAFGFLWRLDMGFAVFLAAIATIVATSIVVPDHRVAAGAIVRGALLAGSIGVALFLAICAARGVAPVPLVLDMKAIVTSNQAFGAARIANARTEIVMLHVYAIPITVLVLSLWMMLHLRGRIDVRDRKFHVFVAVAFLSAYYFANFSRGLVRHTFFEVGNTMTSSFAFLVIAATPYWLLPEARRLASYAGFLALATLLAFNASLDNPAERVVPTRPNPIERTVGDLRHYPRVAYSALPIDRTPVSPTFGPRHLDRIRSFLEGELRADETFLDLSNSPMLYFFTHRIAPHFMNHLLLVYGERLQERVLEDLERQDVPIVLLRTDPAKAAAARVADFSSLDEVPFAFRHYRIHEWVFENYVPFATVQRWQAWIRKDRLLENPPACTSENRLFRWDVASSRIDVEATSSRSSTAIRVGAGNGLVAVPRVTMDPKNAYFVRIEGRADVDARLAFSWSTSTLRGPKSDSRAVTWTKGRAERYIFIPSDAGFRAVENLSIEWDPAFQPSSFELVEGKSDECELLVQGVHDNVVYELGYIPYLWGSRDPSFDRARDVLRDLTGVDIVPGAPDIFFDDVTEREFRHGIRTDRAGFRQGWDGANEPVKLVVGHRIAFAGGAVREVLEVHDQDIFLDGAPLDPDKDGAPRLAHFAVRRPKDGPDPPGTIRSGTQRIARFEPLESKAGGQYFVVRLRSLGARADRLLVDYGEGQRIAGRIAMRIQADGEFHDYAIRLSNQYNWFHRACDWIGMTMEDGTIQVESASITRGD